MDTELLSEPPGMAPGAKQWELIISTIGGWFFRSESKLSLAAEVADHNFIIHKHLRVNI